MSSNSKKRLSCFISFRHFPYDFDFADLIRNKLGTNDIDVDVTWSGNLPSGQHRDQCRAAIFESDFAIVILSPSGFKKSDGTPGMSAQELEVTWIGSRYGKHVQGEDHFPVIIVNLQQQGADGGWRHTFKSYPGLKGAHEWIEGQSSVVSEARPGSPWLDDLIRYVRQIKTEFITRKIVEDQHEIEALSAETEAGSSVQE